jgi:hypothetical protein
MSEASQFRQYAEEALGWVSQSTTEEDKRTLTDLACMWAQAALQSERIFGDASPPTATPRLAFVRFGRVGESAIRLRSDT